jgi:hypothetical protein
MVPLGNRNEFSLKGVQSEDEIIVRVNLKNTTNSEKSIILFGYSLEKNREQLAIAEGDYVYLVARIKLKSSDKHSLQVFIQDKTEYWAKEAIPYTGNTWSNVVVHKKIRAGFTDICMGIIWKPASGNDHFDIQSMKVYVIKKNLIPPQSNN